MRSKRLGLLACLLIAVFLVSVFPVHGIVTMSYDYSTNNDDWTVGSALDQGVGQTIVGNGQYLRSLTVWLKNSSSALTMGEFTGVLMSGKIGNGTRIENSTNTVGYIEVNSPTYVAVTFLFSGDTQLTLSQTFYVGFVVTSQLSAYVKTGESTGGGLLIDKNGLTQAWGIQSSTLACQVYTDTVAGQGGYVPASTATPSGSFDDGSWISTLDFGSVTAWIAVLLLMLIPPFVLGVYMRGGKWGFLIGLAVGTGLSYFVFPLVVPIWLVILVAIGLGAAFLTSVKEGG